MSDVFIGCARVAATTPPELVVIKQMRGTADSKTAAMFLEESNIARLLEHPNLVRGLDAGELEGQPFLVLEYLDGQPVDQVIRSARSARVDEGELITCLLWMLTEALAGLHYAHGLEASGGPLDLVHRDFNPQNLVVGYNGQVKVLDFGIAKTSHRLVRTTSGVIKGKLRYMAPEQALEMRVDRRADVFSAGVMLWEFVSTAAFWAQRSDLEVFDDLVGGVYNPEIAATSPGINAILHKALARAASERYPSADAMRTDLVAEITQRSSLDALRDKTVALIERLFSDRRQRMERLVAQALLEPT